MELCIWPQKAVIQTCYGHSYRVQLIEYIFVCIFKLVRLLKIMRLITKFINQSLLNSRCRTSFCILIFIYRILHLSFDFPIKLIFIMISFTLRYRFSRNITSSGTLKQRCIFQISHSLGNKVHKLFFRDVSFHKLFF